MKNIYRFLFAIVFIVFAPLSSYAQSLSAINGEIKDAETGNGLPGANIILQGTNRGASSAADGGFRITRVKPGSYTLIASLLGYKTEQRSLTLAAGEELSIDLQLTPKLIELNEYLVQADRAFSAASSRAVCEFDIKIRPNRSSQDLLQMAPGLVIAQHAGGGKAEQIFLRGFDADHGTDVNISVDGMPVNLVSHGHGQGYADLHFVMPEIIESIDVYKGPYFAEFGNLATAGAIALRTRDHIEQNSVTFERGGFETSRLTTLYQIPSRGAHHNAYLAGQFYRTDGPVESPQGFRRFNLFGKFHTHLNESSKLSVDVGGFSSAWDASGQIPQRAVDSGLISRFGAIDDLEGGSTGRQNLKLTYETSGANNSDFSIQVYTSRYNFKLFSNFTYFLEDSDNGDMIEQTDQRQILGLNGRYAFSHEVGALQATATLGGGYRADDIEVSLWRSPNRIRLASLVDSKILERNLFLWIQEDFFFSRKLRLQLGLRGDYFTFDVTDRLEGRPGNMLPHASGYAQQTIVSPKANLVFSPTPALDLFANFGAGFHSNDARNIVIDERARLLEKRFRQQGLTDEEIDAAFAEQNIEPGHRASGTLPRAVGAEAGFRTRLANRFNVGAAAWWLDLEREFVYVGDAGTTELSGRTRRYGLDLEARVSLTSWLYGDADVSLSSGEARDEPDEANEIPLAPRLTSTAGLTVRHPAGYEGSLRFRHLGDRPANEDNSVVAKGYTVFDASAAYRLGKYRLNLVVENLFDTDWNEAQFDAESRLRGEVESISEIHFTPGNSRTLRVGISFLF